MKSFLTDLFTYNYDTNQRMMTHVLEHATTPDEQVTHLLSHILNAHHIWNHRIHGVPVDFGVFQHHAPEHWLTLDRENFILSAELLDRVALERKITYVNSKNQPFEGVVSDLLFHVIHHSNYHRAQVNSRLVTLGIPAVVTDYVFYKR